MTPDEEIELSNSLLDRLPARDLHLLCEAWDDGSLRNIFENTLLPKDVVNYPDCYTIERRK